MTGRSAAGARRPWEPKVASSILAALTILLPSSTLAHPGRLDREGCHRVLTPFTYQSGKMVLPGTTHCHRRLDTGLRLDGKEVLEDAPDEVWRLRLVVDGGEREEVDTFDTGDACERAARDAATRADVHWISPCEPIPKPPLKPHF